MNVLLSLLNYSEFGGSQMHVYELSKELVNKGHTVYIISNTGGEIAERSIKNGVIVLPYRELSRIADFKLDIIHCHQKSMVEGIIESKLIPEVPIVQTCHSEILPQEEPLISDRVKAYIGVRETIYEDLIFKYNISPNKARLIYNPIDSSRFNHENTEEGDFILFVGAIDYLRKAALLETLELARKIKVPVKVIGRNDYSELEKEKDIQFYQPMFHVEQYVKKCLMTSGIIKGRTAMEGFMCGKDNLNFEIDPKGNITLQETISAFNNFHNYDSRYIASQIERVYSDVLQNK